MARLIILTHEYDEFLQWKARWPPRTSRYLLYDVLRELERLGHSWRVVRGPKAPNGDAALLHVDATIVSEEYLSLGSRYARTINFGTSDISKRKVSRLVLARDDQWAGRVIVKANLNYRGLIEAEHNRRAAGRGRALPHPGAEVVGEYEILDSMSSVSSEAWENSNLIVEKFLPELDGANYVIRTWVFMGSKERCTRQVAADPIVKAGKVIRYEPSEVPAKLREERKRLNFDFGKFDFVMHAGEPVLLDTNRTPGVAVAIRPLMKAGAPPLAQGLAELMTG